VNEATIIEIRTAGDASTMPGGIALREHPGGGSFMVQNWFLIDRDREERSYCNGAYDLTLVEALEEFHRRCARAERYTAGGALIVSTISHAA
jgi:hypothetical protein